jgi:hypothetical protein
MSSFEKSSIQNQKSEEVASIPETIDLDITDLREALDQYVTCLDGDIHTYRVIGEEELQKYKDDLISSIKKVSPEYPIEDESMFDVLIDQYRIRTGKVRGVTE